MKRYSALFTFLALSFMMGIPLATQAQLLNKLKKAAQDGVEKAVERRVSQEIENAAARQTDRYMTQIFGPPSEYEGTDFDYGKMMSSMNMNVETEDSYSFKGHTDMLLTGTDEKGKEIDPTEFRSFFSENDALWGMELDNKEKDLEKAIMIFDQKNQATIMLMTDKKGEKSRIAYSLDWSKMMEGAMENEMDEMDSTLRLTKTGNTKTILGYTCHEYLSEGEGYSATMWVSEDPVEGYASYWSKNNYLFAQQMQQKYGDQFDELPDGNVLEIHYTSKENEGVTTMQVTDINTTEEVTFVMDDYINIMEQEKEKK